MKRTIIAAAFVSAWTGLAMADDASARDMATLGRPSMDRVYIWLNQDAWREGLALIRAGVHETDPGMVIRLMACVANKGDHAVVVGRPALAAKTVLVIDGAQKGCRGFVTDEDVRE